MAANRQWRFRGMVMTILHSGLDDNGVLFITTCLSIHSMFPDRWPRLSQSVNHEDVNDEGMMSAF